ncbi:hypothetical protein [Herbidospora sp. NBRC 101105]|uniref:hypothetical protein n=1 Tax=Herbidospora sp. NBRC 101105 TaxID=3032195 RepID=UPI0025554255|nr:hypothetical protein [Herbidospora sp. NBRC 101105]
MSSGPLDPAALHALTLLVGRPPTGATSLPEDPGQGGDDGPWSVHSDWSAASIGGDGDVSFTVG